MEFTKSDNYTYNGEVKEYHYSPTASITEQIAFVEMVSDGVFVHGNYLPLLKQHMFDYMLVEVFTDIAMDELVRLDAFDKFNKETGVARHIAKELGSVMCKNLEDSIDANIEYKKNAAHDDISTAIVELINKITHKIEAFGEGLDSDKVMDFIQKFGESGIDGESIVKAYLDSDNYKKNVADIVDAKNSEIRDLKQKLNKETARNVLADKSDKVIPIKGE